MFKVFPLSSDTKKSLQKRRKFTASLLRKKTAKAENAKNKAMAHIVAFRFREKVKVFNGITCLFF
jgi:hypothetical protein